MVIRGTGFREAEIAGSYPHTLAFLPLSIALLALLSEP
jgi:hypothetical protein